MKLMMKKFLLILWIKKIIFINYFYELGDLTDDKKEEVKEESNVYDILLKNIKNE